MNPSYQSKGFHGGIVKEVGERKFPVERDAERKNRERNAREGFDATARAIECRQEITVNETKRYTRFEHRSRRSYVNYLNAMSSRCLETVSERSGAWLAALFRRLTPRRAD